MPRIAVNFPIRCPDSGKRDDYDLDADLVKTLLESRGVVLFWLWIGFLWTGFFRWHCRRDFIACSQNSQDGHNQQSANRVSGRPCGMIDRVGDIQVLTFLVTHASASASRTAPLRPCVRRSVTTLTMSGFCTRPAACRNRHGRRLRADRPRLPELVERLAARMLDVAGHVGAAHGPTQPAGEDRCAPGADSGEADDTRPGMVYSSRLDLSAEGWCRYPKRRHVMSMASTARAMAKKSGSGACQSTGTVSTRPGSNGVV